MGAFTTHYTKEVHVQPGLYFSLLLDETVETNAGGSTRTMVLTPKKYWGLGFNLAEFIVGLRVKAPDNNFGVTLKWQWSLDGYTWITGSTLITQKTAPGDYTRLLSASSELLPYGRVIAEFADTGAATQKTASISAWAYYKYRV